MVVASQRSLTVGGVRMRNCVPNMPAESQRLIVGQAAEIRGTCSREPLPRPSAATAWESVCHADGGLRRSWTLLRRTRLSSRSNSGPGFPLLWPTGLQSRLAEQTRSDWGARPRVPPRCFRRRSVAVKIKRCIFPWSADCSPSEIPTRTSSTAPVRLDRERASPT